MGEKEKSKFEKTRFLVKGSSGKLSLDGSNAASIQKAERDAFRDFSRTTQSNMAIRLDPDVMKRTKTNIKIKDIDFGANRANLKIISGRKSAGSLLSKDSQHQVEDDEYYEEMQLGSKLNKLRKL